MNPRLFLRVDPRTLRVPRSRRQDADPVKLHTQIAKYGNSIVGIPVIEVSRGKDGFFVINNGVTRATRVARLLPNTLVEIEVIDDLPMALGTFPTIEETM
jgi:hypothetical protein